MKTAVTFLFYAVHNVHYFSFCRQLQILYARRMAWQPDLATYLKVRYVWLLLQNMSKKSPGADHWTFDFEGVKDGRGGGI